MNKEKAKLWFKRVGLVGVLFFLIKGLIWLVVIYFVGKNVS
nr:hypothetical protein [uncultured Pedobacter sp.]